MEAIPASVMLDSREMEGTVQVSMYHSVINAQVVELKIFTESFTNKTRYIGLCCLLVSKEVNDITSSLFLRLKLLV